MYEGKSGNQGRAIHSAIATEGGGFAAEAPFPKLGRCDVCTAGRCEVMRGRWGKSDAAVANLRRRLPYGSTEDASRHLISGHCVLREGF